MITEQNVKVNKNYILNPKCRQRGKIIMKKSKNYIPLTKEQKAKVNQIFVHPTEEGSCYSVYLKDSEDVVWCENKSQIYAALK